VSLVPTGWYRNPAAVGVATRANDTPMASESRNNHADQDLEQADDFGVPST
jgi:hypothetical protein